jgi:hypothetical protein
MKIPHQTAGIMLNVSHSAGVFHNATGGVASLGDNTVTRNSSSPSRRRLATGLDRPFFSTDCGVCFNNGCACAVEYGYLVCVNCPVLTTGL